MRTVEAGRPAALAASRPIDYAASPCAADAARCEANVQMNSSLRTPVDAGPARLGALSKLPIFFALEGRRAVLVGGSDGAAWKAEMLAAAGAELVIVTPEPGPELLAIVAAQAPGRVVVRQRAFEPADLNGAAVVVADPQEPGLPPVEEIRALARAQGAIFNAIDAPEHCDFQFGSIVNRHPVVIAVSSDGAAPVLAQAIRRRIEAVLPAGLGRWAAVAKTWRARIAEELKGSGLRRAFWERFVDAAFVGDPEKPEAEIARMLDGAKADAGRAGRVTLVGAGPGDAEYLTLKAVRALQAADVILYDDLVAPEVLELARREARRISVGKRGRGPSCKQTDIAELMLRLALQGARVVRLKSGDPMIFGRAGEEISMARDAGVPVDVVPGVTAALALASKLGASLTHRDHAHSVRFVTGHGRTGELPDHLDWRGLADPTTTLIVYMGGATAGLVAERLAANGLPFETPVVVAEAVGTPREAVRRGRLSGLGDLAAGVVKGAPVLIGIGEVFGEAGAEVGAERAAQEG